MDKIELPNQLAAVLADPLLQKLLVLRKDETTSRRVTHWIAAALADFLEGNSDTKSFVDIMDVLAEYVTRAKVCLARTSSVEPPLTAAGNTPYYPQLPRQAVCDVGRYRRPVLYPQHHVICDIDGLQR